MATVVAEIQPEQRLAAEKLVDKVSTELPEKVSRRKFRFALRRKSSSEIDDPDARLSSGRKDPKARVAHLEVKNAELEKEVDKLRKELKEAADSASRNAALTDEFRVQVSVLTDKNAAITERIDELTTESDELKTSLAGANTELAEVKEELAKAKSEATLLDFKLAKARRPIFGFGAGKSVQASPSIPAGLISPRTRSIDASESWYGRFCGQPADAISTPASTPRGHDSVESWYGRFCGLTEEE